MKPPFRVLLPALLASAAAQAHDGHGLQGPSHWHASDTAGFVVLALVVGLLWWAGRK
jgi:hypothetical protein